jgi:hypothetical protein
VNRSWQWRQVADIELGAARQRPGQRAARW